MHFGDDIADLKEHIRCRSINFIRARRQGLLPFWKRLISRDAARIFDLGQSFAKRLRIPSMTASTSKSTGLQQIGNLKEKERESNPQRNWASELEWDHSKAGTQPWSWVPLTEASASKHPPVFTKDGRYVPLFGRGSKLFELMNL